MNSMQFPKTDKMQFRKLVVVIGILCTLFLFSWFEVSAQELSSATSTRHSVKVGISPTNFSKEQFSDDTSILFQKAYIQAVAQYAKWDCTYIYNNWSELLNQLKRGEIDVLLDVSRTSDRLAYFDYPSEPMGTELCYLFGRNDTEIQFDDFKAFNGLKIGYEKGSTLLDDFKSYGKENGFTFIAVPYESGSAMFSALDAGEVDAVIQTSLYLTPANHVVLAKCYPSPVYVATSKSSPQLIAELNHGISQLFSYNPNFNTDIYRYYFGETLPQTTRFSNEEKNYLASKPIVTVYYESNWRPFEYEEKGQAEGITPDLIRAIGGLTGIKFQFKRFSSTHEIFNSTDSTDTDSVMAVSYDYHWGNSHSRLVTQPYISGSIMRVMKRANVEPSSVAVLKDSYLEQQVRTHYPNIKAIQYLTFRGCMDAVARGDADCTFLNHYQATIYQSFRSYEDFSYQPVEGITQSIALGVNKNAHPALFGLLSKALLSLSHTKLQTILSKNSFQERQLTIYSLLRHHPAQTAGALASLCAFLGILLFLLATASARKKQNKQLSIAKQEAEKANEAKSEFLSRMSHDMRTPLNGIIGMTYLTKQLDLPADARENLTKIDVSSKFLLSLINDVLDMTKAENEKLELKPEPYAPHELLEYLDAVIKPLCDEKKQTFNVTINSPGKNIPLFDKLRLNQLLFNLLSNAMKYTPIGGRIACDVHFGCLTAQRKLPVLLTIRDNGIGMSENFQKVIFEPFTQEKRLDASEVQGTGLGLSIVKRLTDVMGGTINVKSHVNQGTVFTVSLCVDTIPEEQLSGKATEDVYQNQIASLSGRRVLLCEDNPINQEISKVLLEKIGMHVEIAKNGKEGAEKFAQSAPGFYDIILMDIRMPIMNGYESTKMIRDMPRNDAPTVPIIAMTAEAFTSDVQKAMSARMNGHIAKPISPALLYRLLMEKIKID